MSCPTCNNKGYIESHLLKDHTEYPLLIKCTNPQCQYINNYYEAIRNKYSNQQLVDLNIDAEDISAGPISPELIDKAINEVLYKNKNSNAPQDQVNVPISEELISKEEPPVSTKEPPGPHASAPQPVRSESEYPNLPSEFVQNAQKILGLDPDSKLAMTTPFGPYMTETLEDANRVVGIIDIYLQHAEELGYADQQDNIVVFPLDRALGI